MDLKFYLEDLFARPVDVVISSVIKEPLKKSIVESVRYAKGA
jgi:predicted nucleotidyltransferase